MPPRVRPPLRRSEAGDDRGFTVAEALVAFTILLIVSTAAVVTVANAATTEDDSNTRVVAANLVQRDLQAARALRFPNYPTAVASRTETVAGDVYTISRTVTKACPASPDFANNPYMVVTTTATWKPTATRNKVTAATEIAC